MTTTTTTPSERTGTKPTDIVISKAYSKAKVEGITIAGVVWIYRNMQAKFLGDHPFIDAEAVDEIVQLITEANLSVEVM